MSLAKLKVSQSFTKLLMSFNYNINYNTADRVKIVDVVIYDKTRTESDVSRHRLIKIKQNIRLNVYTDK